MSRIYRSARALAALLILGFAFAPAVRAEEAELGWHDTAEFGYVATTGNAESNALGFKNRLWRDWEDSVFNFRVGAVKVETTKIARYAVGTTGAYSDATEENTEVTAENYFANARYDRNFSERFFWYVGAGWERNEPAGFSDRYIGEAGVGNLWINRDDMSFRTSYAATWTKQDDLIKNPAFDDSWIGARITADYMNKFTKSATFTSLLIGDLNVDETDDWRADWTNSISVAMNERMAIKLSLQSLYDNTPALTEVPLFAAADDYPDTPTGDTVLVELDDLDNIFTASLVLNF